MTWNSISFDRSDKQDRSSALMLKDMTGGSEDVGSGQMIFLDNLSVAQQSTLSRCALIIDSHGVVSNCVF